MAHTQFSQEFENFELSFESLKSPTEADLVGQRAERKFMPYKLGLFAQTVSQLLYNMHGFKSFEFCKDYTVEDFGDIITHHFDTKRVFNDLVRISVKKAHEKLLNLREQTSYKDDVLSLNRSELVGEITKSLAIEVLYAVLSRGESQQAITGEAGVSMATEIQNIVLYQGLLLQTESYNKTSYLSFVDIIQAIIAMFIASGFFTNVINTTKDKKGKVLTSTQLILPDKLIVDVFRPLKFPHIVRPSLLRKKDIDSLITPLINGMGTLTKSDALVTALNISRLKPHKVNVLFLRLCQEFFKRNPETSLGESVFEKWLNEGTIDVGTPSRRSIDLMRLEIEKNTKGEYSNFTLSIANAVLVQLSKTFGLGVKSYINMLVSSGLTKAESIRYHAVKKLNNDYNSAVVDTKFTQSRIFLAKALLTFPVYVTDTLCIRLRKYPREHWISRTAGQLKHLLENYKERKLTDAGLRNLLCAYYQASPSQLACFESFLTDTTQLSGTKTKKELLVYFRANPLNFTEIKKPLYFMNLHLSLLNAFKNGLKTAVNVEVDQNASALVILSLVLRSRDMAKACNVIGGDKKSSPYSHIKSKFKNFSICHDQEIYTPENKDVMDFLQTSRSLHKYAIMCFCYNQTIIGRIEDFEQEWLKEHGFQPNPRQRKVLINFATHYDKFVEYVFPRTIKKLDILKKVVDLVCEEAPHLQMTTLDGEIINWAFYATEVRKRKFYDPVKRKHESYSTSTILERTQTASTVHSEFPNNFQIDKRGMRKRFLSYLIHSIDAGILRRIINKMRKEHKVSVNHLHDCVILHPNDLDAFYDVVKSIYSSQDLYNIIETSVFDSVIHTLSRESRVKLMVLKKEFFELCDDFGDEVRNINPHHMYSLED